MSMQRILRIGRPLADRRGRARRRGFSIIEVLVVCCVILLLVGMILPALSTMRYRSREAVSLSNLRSISSRLWMYADESNGLPPVFLPAKESYYPPDEITPTTINGTTIAGRWFDHSFAYHLAFAPAIPRSALLAPGSNVTAMTPAEESRGGLATDYWLASVFYADPPYWHTLTQVGPSQWHAQRLGDMLFPSNKGVVFQYAVYGAPRMRPRQFVLGQRGVRGGVAWGDHSVTIVTQGDLLPGVPNFFDHYQQPPPGLLDVGLPIHETAHGIRGRDR
ncbi:hypothetical protein PHYC_03978 [Phycisphaerales bacterium]|nr:hypothetical protein PHYC_03978 [Phycisphaerales bacterium]